MTSWSAEALLGIINDILDFSKMEAGRLELEAIPFDLVTAVESVIDIVAPRTVTKPVELACIVPAPLCRWFLGDLGRIRQILLNLLGNAVKFTEKGSVIAEVVPIEDSESAARIRFQVRDTGIGIPADALPNLFQVFTQVDATTARRFGGTGLGLAICKRLVELMGGEIGVESTPGHGSTFRFDLTLPKAEAVTDSPPASGRIDGVSVLVVDDNEVNREIFDRQLRMWGAVTGTASSGTEALDLLRRAQRAGTPYVAALLDQSMPDMTGLELAAAIRNDGSLTGCRLLLATSLHMGDIRARAKALGIAAVIMKPVRQSSLLETMVRICGFAGQIAPQAGPTAEVDSVEPERSLRILLAEDNVINQQVAVGLLRRFGHRTDVAANGLEALTLVRNGCYDLILMDVQMPEMDGYQATASIRALDGPCRSIPIIAMTANALPGDPERCRAAGMDDYLSKPIDRRKLAAALQNWGRRLGRMDIALSDTLSGKSAVLVTAACRNSPVFPLLDRLGLRVTAYGQAVPALQDLSRSAERGDPRPLVVLDGDVPDMTDAALAHLIEGIPELCDGKPVLVRSAAADGLSLETLVSLLQRPADQAASSG